MIGGQAATKRSHVLIVLSKVFPADQAVVSGFIEFFVCVNINVVCKYVCLSFLCTITPHVLLTD